MKQAKLKAITVITEDNQTVEIKVSELKRSQGGFVYFSRDGNLFIPINKYPAENTSVSFYLHEENNHEVKKLD